MSFWDEVDIMLKKLRKGEETECPHCKKGKMLPVGNHETTTCFYCDKCGKKLNIN